MADGDLLDFRRPFDADGLIVNGKRFDADLTASLTAARIEMTMEGPSVLTLEALDPQHTLLRSGALGKKWAATVVLAGVSFTLSELGKTEYGCRLVFYDSAAAKLKRVKHRAIKLSRNRFTRADVIHGMCDQAGARFASPDEHSRQPIEPFTPEELNTLRQNRPAAITASASSAPRETPPSASAEAGAGVGVRGAAKGSDSARKGKAGLLGKGITIKGARATSHQLRNITIAMKVAEDVSAFPDSPRATLAMLCAGIGESGFQSIPNSQGSGYHGVFQGSKSVFSIGDTAGMARCFFKGGKGFQGGGALEQARRYSYKSPGHIALTVEGSVSNFASVAAGIEHYDKHRGEAEKIMRAWSPGDDDGSGLDELNVRVGRADRAYVQPFEFRVEANESYWSAAVRLAEEVGWRLFAVGNRIWYASDLTLARATPLMVVREGDEGIESVLWDVDEGGHISEMQVRCRLMAWRGAPGNVVVVEGEAPQADGRWLVRSIERDLLDTGGAAIITLSQPVDPKLEPKSNIVVTPGVEPAADAGGTTAGTGKGSTNLRAAAKRNGARGIVEAAANIAAAHGTYVGSDYRPGDRVASGAPSDHSGNDSSRAARDIGVQGINLLTGPPSPKIDRACKDIVEQLGGNYQPGTTIIHDFYSIPGYRVQIIWRTPLYGGHLGHIHIGARVD